MSGPSSEYDAHDEGVIESALDRAFQDYETGGGGGGTGPTDIRITAQIEWAGTVDNGRGGVRTTKLDGLNLGPVKAALDKARSAGHAADAARPLKSLTATGWHAQLRAITGTAAGYAAADRAGLGPTNRTLMKWLAEDRTPSKANRERISQAYESMRTRPVDTASRGRRSAQKELADKLSAAVEDRYGAEVRFRGISGLELS